MTSSRRRAPKLLFLLTFFFALTRTAFPEETEETIIWLKDIEDPFATEIIPAPLVEPAPEEIEKWTYILRYTEEPFGYTRLVYEIRASTERLEVRAIRFWGDEVELLVTHERINDQPERQREPLEPPEWSLTLPPSDEVHGLDGTMIWIELFTRKETRTLYRWSPEHREYERQLSEMNEWIAAWKDLIGIDSRKKTLGPMKTLSAKAKKAESKK